MVPFVFLSGVSAHAQIGASTDFIDDAIPCHDCGFVSTDWQRYRNIAFNVCVWGPRPPEQPHECHVKVENSVLFNDADWISVCVEPGIDDVALANVCQYVNIRFSYQPGITIDLPWIDTDITTGQVIEIHVQTTLPNGDSQNHTYAPNQDRLPVGASSLPYPDDHPLFGDDEGNDNGGNQGGNTGTNTGQGSGPGGNCGGGQHSGLVP